jgi:exodeoxyribonuclease VII small subunit
MPDPTATLPATDAATTNPPPFEALLTELDKLVSDLEGGKLALEDSLAAFERGMQVSKQAAAILDAAEARIEQLTASGDVKPLDLGQG